MNAAIPAISLKRNAWPMPSLSFAPKNWVMNMPPDMQMALTNTMNTNSTCPATLTPDMQMSPRPETMKLSISDTRLCISCCSMIGTAMASAPR